MMDLARMMGGAPPHSFNGVVVSSTASGTSHTYAGLDFGVADSSRIVVVEVSLGMTVASYLTAATIGGVSATCAGRALGTSGQLRLVDVWYASVPTGTSGDFVGTSSAATQTAGQAYAYSLYALGSSTPYDAQTNTNNATGVSPSLSVTISKPSGGVLVGVWGAASDTGTDHTWTNATEAYDNVDTSGGRGSAAAFDTGLASGSVSVSCTSTDTSVNRPGIVVVTWV